MKVILMEEQENEHPLSFEKESVTTDLSRKYDLSVITICRNDLKGVMLTLESVLKQRHYNKITIEHVIVDGASQDGTAEWLQQAYKNGKIDSYVSEPDRGIYDAMNKGIAMAHGKVLSFINSGDGYASDDISPCVQHILSNQAKYVAGHANCVREDGSFSYVRRFWPQAAYFNMLACHQSFFFDAATCRELGGYDVDTFKIVGDLDLINKFLRKYGMPIYEDRAVCFFSEGGVSSDCWNSHRSEYIEIQWRYWQELMIRCRKDRQFASMMVSMLVSHCHNLGRMEESELQYIERQKKELDEMIRNFPLPSFTPFKNILLKIAAAIAFQRRGILFKNKVLDLCNLLSRISYNSPYIFWGPKLIRYVRMIPFVKG